MGKNVFWIAPVVVMAIGTLPMPYGYYALSRLVVSGCAVYFAHRLYRDNQISFVWIFGFFAILYNPIIPIHLYQKEIWMVVNTLTALVFFLKRKDVLKEKSDA